MAIPAQQAWRCEHRPISKVGISLSEGGRLRRFFSSRIESDSLADHSDEKETHSRGLERVPQFFKCLVVRECPPCFVHGDGAP